MEQEQLSFSVTSDTKPHQVLCIADLVYQPDQGGVVLDLPPPFASVLHLGLNASNEADSTDNTTTDSSVANDNKDLGNSKMQYTMYKVDQSQKRDIRVLFTSICLLSNRNIHLQRQILAIDATSGVRSMLGKDDFIAEWRGL